MAPTAKTTSAYVSLSEGLDHVMSLLVKGDDMPINLQLRGASPFALYTEIHEIAEQRQHKLERRHAKAKLSANNAKAKTLKHDAEEVKETREELKKVVIRVKPETTKKHEKETEKVKTKSDQRVVPTVKTLDLSGVNLSPVITQPQAPALTAVPAFQLPKAPVRMHRQNSTDGMKPLALETTTKETMTTPRSELLLQIQRLPLLESLVAGSNKHNAIIKWVEMDDGKNKGLSKSLLALVNKLQRDGRVPLDNTKTSAGGSGASARKQWGLYHETLDDRLKTEGFKQRKRRNGNKTNGKAALKTERRLKKPGETSSPRAPSRKRPLNGFVVGSDEEEYEDDGGSGGDDSEAEYESGDEEEDEGDQESSEEEFELRVEERLVPVKANGRGNGSPQAKEADTSRSKRAIAPSPPSSAKASPRAAVGASSPDAPVRATDQLALVAARIRAAEEEDTATATSAPTYLSYTTPQETSVPETTVPETKEVVATKAATIKLKMIPVTTVDGSSESNAIVLDDSDDDEEEEEEEEKREQEELRVILPRPAQQQPTTPKPKPSPQQPKQHIKTPPKQPAKPRTKQVLKTNSAPKAASKAKASSVPTPPKKRKNSDSDADDAVSEAEFVRPEEEEGSSTDVDGDLFDLNEEDVYVVESILEIKPGKTGVTNSGRLTKEADLFLVKWAGYDELTWEPDANIPNRLIQFFRDREASKRQCQFQIDKFLERRDAKNSTTGKDEVIYLIKWENVPAAYWEVKSNLPARTVLWLEKTSREKSGKIGVSGISGPSRKKAKN